jgi:hypothetical protein
MPAETECPPQIESHLETQSVQYGSGSSSGSRIEGGSCTTDCSGVEVVVIAATTTRRRSSGGSSAISSGSSRK